MYNKFYLKDEITDPDKWYVVDRMKDEVLMEEGLNGCPSPIRTENMGIKAP